MFHGKYECCKKDGRAGCRVDVTKLGDDPGNQELFLDEKPVFLTQRQMGGDESEIYGGMAPESGCRYHPAGTEPRLMRKGLFFRG
jgi:hypothetical protein